MRGQSANQSNRRPYIRLVDLHRAAVSDITHGSVKHASTSRSEASVIRTESLHGFAGHPLYLNHTRATKVRGGKVAVRLRCSAPLRDQLNGVSKRAPTRANNRVQMPATVSWPQYRRSHNRQPVPVLRPAHGSLDLRCRQPERRFSPYPTASSGGAGL